jgi:hypothetical protein
MKDQLIRRTLRKLNNMAGQNISGLDYKEELYNPVQLATTAGDSTGLGNLNSLTPNGYIADIES